MNKEPFEMSLDEYVAYLKTQQEKEWIKSLPEIENGNEDAI